MKFLTLAGGALALAIAASQPVGATTYGAGYNAGFSASHVIQATYGHRRLPLPRVLYNLRQKGFYDFRNIGWTSHTYKVTAKGVRGNLVRVTVNAYSGRVIDVDILQYRHGNGHGGHGGHGGWGHGGHGGHGGWGQNYGGWRL